MIVFKIVVDGQVLTKCEYETPTTSDIVWVRKLASDLQDMLDMEDGVGNSIFARRNRYVTVLKCEVGHGNQEVFLEQLELG